MGRTAALDQFQCLVELGLGIAGKRQHDVAADVLEPGLLCSGKGRPCLLCGVGTPQRAQLAVPGGLHPEGDAVHPRLPEASKACRGDGLGVRFQRDLSPGQRPGGVDQAFDLLRAQQAGSSAAEVQGIRLQGALRRKPVQLPQQGIHIGVRHAAFTGMRIKIAVAAFGKTIGNMQIESERHMKSQPFS